MHKTQYAFKSHPTTYSDTVFRSRLEARWAAFFDLIGWDWQYEPIDLEGWTPDFYVVFRCGHSACRGSHSLLVEVKPYFDIEQFEGHPCMDYQFGCKRDGLGSEIKIPADASAAFGANPWTTRWVMEHGDGGGVWSLYDLCLDDMDRLWAEAGNIVQFKSPKLR
jgi:hypothetical protein